MPKDKKVSIESKKTFEEVFDQMIDLGLNPCSGFFTIYGSMNADYQMYAKSRINVIKRGEDLVYRIKEVISFVITKIKK